MRRALLAMLVAMLPSFAAGQSSLTEEWRWVRFGVAEGLPSRIVTSVVRGTDGVMWAATENGPAWFDGYRWRRIVDTKGQEVRGEWPVTISAGAAGAVLLSVDTALYVVPRRGAPAERIRAPSFPFRWRGRPVAFGTEIWSIFGDGPSWFLGRLVNGTWQREAWPAEGPRIGFEPRLFTLEGRDLALSVGAALYVRRDDRWQRVVKFHDGHAAITHVVRAKDGELRLVLVSPDSQQGVWEHPSLAPTGPWQRFPEFGHEAPVAFDAGPDGSAAAILDAGDFLYCDSNGWRRLVAPRLLATAQALAYDVTGDVWLATRDGLVLWRRTSERWTQWRVASTSPANRVNGMAVSRAGRVAVATAGGVAFLEAGERLRIDETVPRLMYTSVAWDTAGRVWAGSGASFAGVYQQTSSGWVHRTDAPGLGTAGIHRMVTGRDGSVWLLGLPVGSNENGGLWRIRDARIDTVSLPAAARGARFYDMVEDSSGTRWFATNVGLLRERGGAWDVISDKQVVPGDPPYTVALGDDGGVLVGLRSHGVVRVTRDLKVQLPDSDAPRPQGYVKALHRTADGHVWASNADGIWVLSDGTWSLLTGTFGLPTPAVWPIVSIGNDVYVGTLGAGVVRLRLSEFRDATPVVQLASPVRDESGLLARWTVATPRGLVSPADMTTRWRLDGNAWSAWKGSTDVTLPVTVPWRRHLLEVEARTPLGARTLEPAQLEFVVPPPVWWNREVVLSGITLVLLLVWVSILLVRRRRQHLAMARRVREAERMELVGSFAAGMAHEFNNLLTTIIVNTELVDDQVSTGGEPTPASEIRRAALQAAGQVRSLLSFTRDQALVLVPIDLPAALNRQRGAINSLFGANVETSWDLGSVPLIVRAEANGLTAIIRALAENARDAMPAGGRFRLSVAEVALSVDRRHQLGLGPADRYAEVMISDSGTGMTREESQRAFEPYFSTRDRPGLGLALVYGLTQRFGGAVEIVPAPGRGTVVRLYLPLVPGVGE